MRTKLRSARLHRRNLAQAVGKKTQRPLGRNAGVELAHRTGSGIAGVDEGFQPTLPLLLIQSLKIISAHVHLTAHLQHRWHRVGQAQGNLTDGANVLGDVLTHFAITPRCGLHQHTVLVAQAHRQAIKLGLGHVLNGRR